MKRGDQHPVTSPQQHPENFDPGTQSSGETGLDMPGEKEIAVQVPSPSMGALPVDNFGSLKTGTAWQSSMGDESHVDQSKEIENPVDPRPTVAIGSGPDPEHVDDSF